MLILSKKIVNFHFVKEIKKINKREAIDREESDGRQIKDSNI